MKLIYLWVSVLVISGVAGAAALTNDIEVDGQDIGIFGWNVLCRDNGGGYFCNAISTATGETTLIAYENPDVAGDDFLTGVIDSPEGCSPSSWTSAETNLSGVQWPAGYLPDDNFESQAYFNTQIVISSGGDPTFHDALQSEGDGINKLARHSVAALLNAAHPEIDYPVSIIDIISYTQASIDNQEYSFADVLAFNNNLGKETLCDKVE